jgi:hypothetical protein
MELWDFSSETSELWGSGTSEDFTFAHPKNPELRVFEYFHITPNDIIMLRYFGAMKIWKFHPSIPS